MLNFTSSTQIHLVTGPTDLPKHFDSRAAIVSGTLKSDPYAGDVQVFCNRQRNRIKLLVWDSSGFFALAKRLEQGTFVWPGGSESTVDMSSQKLGVLLAGSRVGQATVALAAAQTVSVTSTTSPRTIQHTVSTDLAGCDRRLQKSSPGVPRTERSRARCRRRRRRARPESSAPCAAEVRGAPPCRFERTGNAGPCSGPCR